MIRVRSKLALLAIAAVVTILAGARAGADGANSPRTILVSRNADGQLGNGVSAFPTISADGRFVAFQSVATNLTADATDGTQQVYVLDRKKHKVELISVNRAGEPGNEESSAPAISFDGRYVAFKSHAENLVPNDTNEQTDTFVFDRLTDRLERVSVSSRGEEGTGVDDSEELEEHGGLQAVEGHPPSISGDGRFVVFWTGLNGLVRDDTDDVIDVFVRDRASRTTKRISKGLDGAPANGASRRAKISGPGDLVVFDSEASNLVADDTNGKMDIFAYDVARGRVKKLTRAAGGGPTNDDSLEPHLDYSGRIVAFTSWASNLVATDANNTRDAFVIDRETSAVELVSLASNGSQLPAPTFEAGPSPDGRYIAMMTLAGILPAPTANIYLFDRRTKQREQLNVDSQGRPGDPLVIGSLTEPIADPSVPAMTPGATSVAFWTTAANLVAGDTNGVGDVFIRERGKRKHHGHGHDGRGRGHDDDHDDYDDDRDND